jgi:hypothetical protein
MILWPGSTGGGSCASGGRMGAGRGRVDDIVLEHPEAK